MANLTFHSGRNLCPKHGKIMQVNTMICRLIGRIIKPTYFPVTQSKKNNFKVKAFIESARHALVPTIIMIQGLQKLRNPLDKLLKTTHLLMHVINQCPLLAKISHWARAKWILMMMTCWNRTIRWPKARKFRKALAGKEKMWCRTRDLTSCSSQDTRTAIAKCWIP